MDLSSAVVSLGRDDEMNGTNVSELPVGPGVSETLADRSSGLGSVDEGLGSVGRRNGAEAETGRVDSVDGAKAVDMLIESELEGNDGGDANSAEKSEGKSNNVGTFYEEEAETGHVDSVNGAKAVDMSIESDLEGNDDGDVTLAEKRERESKNVGAFSEVERKEGAMGGTSFAEEGGDRNEASQLVEEKMNVRAGCVALSDLEYGRLIPVPMAVSSRLPLHGVVKADNSRVLEFSDQLPHGSLSLAVADGDLKYGGSIENEGTEIKGDSSRLVHLVDDAAPHINGFGSDGNQQVVTKAPTRGIHQPQYVGIRHLKHTALLETQGKECWTENENQFHASDLVWGKVRSHPWWPGQIFDPADSSEKAMRYCKKDRYLIAYFGDQTFAWNEASRIKPFYEHFSKMEKQSSMEAFCHAVHCALEEASRRVEFGLACLCLSEEVYKSIKTQIIVNAGVRKESSRRDGGDENSSAGSFIPTDLVHYLKALAQSPSDGTDQLKFVTARAQLLAFNRWKGFYQLPKFKMLGDLLEDEANALLTGETKCSEGLDRNEIRAPTCNEQVPMGKGKLTAQDSSFRKRKKISKNGVSPSKKERRISDLLSESHKNLSDEESEPGRKASRKLTYSSVKKHKSGDIIPDDSKAKIGKTSLSPLITRHVSRIGESITRVARKLAVSTPILKNTYRKTGYGGSNKTSSDRRQVILAECPPPNEMLSQLFLVAKDPIGVKHLLSTSVDFLSEFRNSFCLEDSTLLKREKSMREVPGKQTGKKLSTLGSNTEGQASLELETPNGKGSAIIEPEAALELDSKLNLKQESAVVNSGLEAKPTSPVDEKCKEQCIPTALILNFTNSDTVPPIPNLNQIFSRYGPLEESETVVLKKSKLHLVKVVFKRCADAETAFSSTGKYSMFGPSLVSYRLDYSPVLKTSNSATKQCRKATTSVEGSVA